MNSEQPQPVSLEEKVAQAQRDLMKWSAVAADPTLSPQAAQVAANLARSSAAALKLGKKELLFQQGMAEDPESPNPDYGASDPALLMLLGLTPSPQNRTTSSPQSPPASSTRPGTFGSTTSPPAKT